MREILGIKVYTTKEAAALLELSTNTIHTYIKNGTLPARKIAGVYHITEDNLKEYIRGERFTDPVTGQRA